MTSAQLKMVEEFQCPGCVCGHEVSSCYKGKQGSFSCESHVAGTIMFPHGALYLGLPKGFNKVGQRGKDENNSVWLYESMEEHNRAFGTGDNCNVAVWAMEKDGYLFVRFYSPRINRARVHVIKGAKLSDLSGNPLDVSTFIEEID